MGYLNLVGSFVYKEPLFRTKLAALANNDAQLKTDGWAQSTKCLFYQAAVPSGWTQDVSQNDKAFRVVSTAGAGSGGTHALSATITLAHTHVISADDGHTHAFASHTHIFGSGSAGSAIGNSTYLYFGSSLLQRIGGSGGATTQDTLRAKLTTPSSPVTLGSVSTHNHGGVTDSALTDFVFAYCDVIIGTKGAPGGTYTDLTASWHTGDKINFDPFQSFAANDAYNLGNLMPASTIMVFGQASASIGWTKVSTTNDRMLRVVSAVGGGTGGSQLTSSGVTLTHANAVTAVTDHSHTIPNHTHGMADTVSSTGLAPLADPNAVYVQSDGSGNLVTSADVGPTASRAVYNASSANDGTTSSSAAGAHTHSLVDALADFIPAFLDVIQCSKDATGAPYSYTDYTAEFAWKQLVSYQRLNTLAKNDAYLEYHTTPSDTKTFFFMATTPSGWTKLLTQHDKALRMVSGSSGGTLGGGSHLMSDVIALAHTHGIVATGGHTHTVNHTHALATTTLSANAPTAVPVHSTGANIDMGSGATGGTIRPKTQLHTTSENPTESDILTADPDHNHSGITDSQLTDFVLAYADVIWCTKS